MKCWHDNNISCLPDCELIENCQERERMLEVRADAIEEFLLKAKEKKYHSKITYENCVAIAELDWLAEELKEQKNDY